MPTKRSATATALPRKSAGQRVRAAAIYDALLARYPDAHCELDAGAPHELLIATILSAQSPDTSVNRATPALFKAFRTPRAFAESSPEAIEPYIRSLNFYRNKAWAVHASMTTIVDRFGGQVPRTMRELLTLRGVARKTANVVLGNAFGLAEGVVVDTHVARLSARFKLSRHIDPARIEQDLMALFPRDRWIMLSHLLIFHGRRVCKARGALCATDPICMKFCANARGAGSSRPAARARHGAKA